MILSQLLNHDNMVPSLMCCDLQHCSKMHSGSLIQSELVWGHTLRHLYEGSLLSTGSDDSTLGDICVYILFYDFAQSASYLCKLKCH